MHGTIRTLALAMLLACAGEALAHGGAYTPPTPRGPRGPRAPGTPAPKIPGPTTPTGGVGGATTPGRAELPPALDDWTRWWFANRRLLLPPSPRAAASPDGTTSAASPWRERARALLRAGLADGDDDVSSASAIALGKAQDAASAPTLVVLLVDRERDASVREAAALALGLLGASSGGTADTAAATDSTAADEPDEPVEALLDVAQDRRAAPRLRAMCEYGLALRRAGRAAELFRRAIRGPSAPGASVPSAATSGLGMLGDPDSRGDLEKMLAQRGDKHRTARGYAAHGLARLAGTDSVAALRTALGSRDASTRRAAALALGAVGARDEATSVVLAATLRDDPDPSCRGAAALSIGRLGVTGSRAALESALRDKEPLVRPYAALGLGLLAAARVDLDVARPLLAVLSAPGDDSLRGAAACALGLARARAATPALLAIVQQRGDPRLRAHAAFALGRVGGGVEERQALRELLIAREHEWMPREAALALGAIGDRSSVRILARLLSEDVTLHVQAAGALALGRIGGNAAGAALTQLLGDTARMPLARAMAAVALGQMLSRAGRAPLGVVAADLDWHLFTPAVREVLSIL